MPAGAKQLSTDQLRTLMAKADGDRRLGNTLPLNPILVLLMIDEILTARSRE